MVNKLKRICLLLPGLSCSLLPLNSKALTLHQECQGLYYTDKFRFIKYKDTTFSRSLLVTLLQIRSLSVTFSGSYFTTPHNEFRRDFARFLAVMRVSAKQQSGRHASEGVVVPSGFEARHDISLSLKGYPSQKALWGTCGERLFGGFSRGWAIGADAEPGYGREDGRPLLRALGN